MADTIYKGNLTRAHWGGAASDVDIHLEVYQNVQTMEVQAEEQVLHKLYKH